MPWDDEGQRISDYILRGLLNFAACIVIWTNGPDAHPVNWTIDIKIFKITTGGRIPLAAEIHSDCIE